MSLSETKKVTEKYIQDNWTTTPIFYDTQDIIGDEAIHLSFIPIAREAVSTCNNGGHRVINHTMMKISFYAKNTLRVLDLQDEMIELLECFNSGNLHYDIASFSGEGSINLTNGIVESIVLFNAKEYT